jgi:hypothetical protein
MGESKLSSLTIPDARADGASMRVTWHPDRRKVVVSHWRDQVCVATTPIELSEVPGLISVLVDALGEAINDPAAQVSPETRESLLTKIAHWLTPRVASVTELPLGSSPRLAGQGSDPQDTELGGTGA